jgi:signal transduction histidine kinase/CheY-like chemotaxis protein
LNQKKLKIMPENNKLDLEQINKKLSLEISEREQSENINNVLFSISNAVNTSTDLDDLYGKIHHFVGKIIDVKNFFIAIVSERKQTLYFPYYVDSRDEDFSPITNFDPKNSLTGFVVSNHKPLLINEKALQELAENNAVWGPVPLIWMGVPLVVREEIIGVIAVQSYSDPHLYNEKDLEVLVSISDQMAIAIDRKGTENELTKSEEKYRSMMESFADPLYICSSDFRIEYVNPGMLKLIGHDTTGERCYSGIHGLNSKCEWCVFDQISDGETIEIDIKSPLNDRNYRVSSMPIQNSDGTVSKMTIFRDITHYLNAVMEKEKAQTQLLQVQKMESIGNLAGGIAHDFNNILSAIIGFTELALDDAPNDSAQQENLQEVYAAGNRAKELVQQILAFARQSTEETKPIRLSDIIVEVLKLVRPSTPTTIDIVQTIHSDSSVIGNSSQLHQVILNLCTNAIQSLQGSGGVLEIDLRDVAPNKDSNRENQGQPAGHWVKLAITDNGQGIDSAIIDNIFEPYFTTKGIGEGTGMGLAMVKGIVESYGGKIEVKSTPGKETIFTILFPLSTSRDKSSLPQKSVLAPGTEHILFVDDEPPIAKMGSRLLGSLGYKVTIRTSSFEALELFKEKSDEFDLVMTDMTMPSMTGDEFSMEIRKIRQDIPIILCTGYSNKIDEKLAKSIGIDAFAYKPYTKSDIAKTIRELLDANHS